MAKEDDEENDKRGKNGETSMFGALGKKSMEQILQGLRDEED